MPIDHDALFKRLLTAFFREFLALFVPQLARALTDAPLIFLDKEQLDGSVDPDRREADLVVRAELSEHPATILIHLEHQAQPDAQLNRRMFRYFARFHDQHELPIYPIALCSYTSPRRAAPAQYAVNIVNDTILDFRYRVLQLNQLDWRAYLQTSNPVAVALMSRMAVVPADRWRVKAASLRLLAGLPLNASQRRLIGQFIDVYTVLNPGDEQVFCAEVARFPLNTQEVIMETMGSWELRGHREGRKEGRKEGRLDGKRELLEQMLTDRFGTLSASANERLARLRPAEIRRLAKALFSFGTLADLERWLAALPPAPPPAAAPDAADDAANDDA